MGWARQALDKVAEATVVLSYGAPGYRLRAPGFAEDEVDLRGKVVVVTGGNAGIGLASATALAERGARLFLLGRNAERLAAAQAQVDGCETIVADLSELDDVRQAADEINRRADRIDRLVLNAGVMLDERRQTRAGLETTFATNVLGGFLLTRLLEERLHESAPARVIHVSSGGMYTQRIDLDKLQGRGAYDGVTAYAQTKRAQVILSEMWNERWRGRGITSHAMHPGWADTPGVQRSLPRFRAMLKPLLRDAGQAADTIVWLCATPDVDDQGGLLWLDRAPRRTHVFARTRESSEQRRALWELCERLIE